MGQALHKEKGSSANEATNKSITITASLPIKKIYN